jgi:hypothetical protein
MGIEEVLTAPHAPWQNAFVERSVGSARRECFDHVIVFNEAGVRKLMTLYCAYHEKSRTHLALDKDTPIPRPVMPPGDGGIVAIPEIGGLHHRSGIHKTGAGSGTTATGRGRRFPKRTGSSRIGRVAATSKGTGIRRADITTTTIAGIAIAHATGIASGGSTETTTIAIAVGGRGLLRGARRAWPSPRRCSH